MNATDENENDNSVSPLSPAVSVAAALSAFANVYAQWQEAVAQNEINHEINHAPPPFRCYFGTAAVTLEYAKDQLHDASRREDFTQCIYWAQLAQQCQQFLQQFLQSKAECAIPESERMNLKKRKRWMIRKRNEEETIHTKTNQTKTVTKPTTTNNNKQPSNYKQELPNELPSNNDTTNHDESVIILCTLTDIYEASQHALQLPPLPAPLRPIWNQIWFTRVRATDYAVRGKNFRRSLTLGQIGLRCGYCASFCCSNSSSRSSSRSSSSSSSRRTKHTNTNNNKHHHNNSALVIPRSVLKMSQQCLGQLKSHHWRKVGCPGGRLPHNVFDLWHEHALEPVKHLYECMKRYGFVDAHFANGVGVDLKRTADTNHVVDDHNDTTARAETNDTRHNTTKLHKDNQTNNNNMDQHHAGATTAPRKKKNPPRTLLEQQEPAAASPRRKQPVPVVTSTTNEAEGDADPHENNNNAAAAASGDHAVAGNTAGHKSKNVATDHTKTFTSTVVSNTATTEEEEDHDDDDDEDVTATAQVLAKIVAQQTTTKTASSSSFLS